MLNLRVAVFQFKEPSVYVINEKGQRFEGILGNEYQTLYDHMKFNVTYFDKSDFKKMNTSSEDEGFKNDDIFFLDLINRNIVDIYFRPIPLEAEFIVKENIRISPVVSFATTRLLQCIHRKDDYNYLDVLTGLKDLNLDFWLKVSSIFILLLIPLISTFFIKKYYRRFYRYKTNLAIKLNLLISFIFLFYMRIITRQSDDRRIYNNLNFIRYILLFVILFMIVIHQVLFFVAFQDLKFRNMSFILRDLQQVLQTPGLTPCFLESETIIQSKIADINSITYKLYKHQKNVCFFSNVMGKKGNDDYAIDTLMNSIIVGTDDYVEYFGYLFCGKYTEFLHVVLKQMLNKELDKNLPIFWYPTSRGDETLLAFFISKETPKPIKDAINKFAYRTYEHGWIQFLKDDKKKIDKNYALDKCFTDNYDRISFPYRFAPLILSNFSIIFNFIYFHSFILFFVFIINWIVTFFNRMKKLN